MVWFVLLFFLWAPATVVTADDQPRLQPVQHDRLVRAMRASAVGFDPLATSNIARFQAEVILSLAREALAENPDGPPIFVDHATWYRAYLEAFNLAEEEAPIATTLAYKFKQDLYVDYRSDRVIRKIERGPEPDLALNVLICWPDTIGLPSKYSFRDTLASPRLKVTNHRVITFRLLDYGDMIVYDEIRGLTGRPLNGVLALFFKVIGEGRVVYSRLTVSEDGLQINRTHAKKGFVGVTATVTIYPDGFTQKGLPPDRADLLALETRLKQPLKIKYHPIQLVE